jgi:hypothetical protein
MLKRLLNIYLIGDTQFVQDRIDAAFRLMTNSVTELGKTPINPNVDDWFNTLFGRPASQLSDNRVLNRFRRLGQLSQRTNDDRTSSTKLGEGLTDVRFYCTTKRITKRSDGRYVNKDRNNLAYVTGEVTSRFASCYDLKPPTLMVTMRMGPNEYSEIQICPWFLQQARGLKFTDLAHIGQYSYALLSKWKLPKEAKKFYTPLDTYLLMDKVIVHELTHADQAYPATTDLSEDPYGKNPSRPSCRLDLC